MHAQIITAVTLFPRILPESCFTRLAVAGRGRVYLCSDDRVVVTKEHIDKVVGRLQLEGKFGDDNRAGFPGQLHRVSVMRRKVKATRTL